jgi:HEPN domain-containing protein
MRNRPDVEEWMRRARSNIARAKIGKVSEDMLYEDLCFDCQQAVEKSLKGLLICIGTDFPWTHSIARLVELIEETGLDVPEYVKDSIALTAYAVSTRYPGNQEPVDESEYREALRVAESVYHWVDDSLRA